MKHATYWRDTEPVQAGAPLGEDLSCDVCIVGAGYTGLWTAHFLKQHDAALSVVVLEADFAGAGASGHNEGFVLQALGARTPESLVAEFGRARTMSTYAELRRSAVDLSRFCVRLNLDAQFEASQIYQVAATKGQLKLIARDVELAAALAGYDPQVLRGPEIRARIGSPVLTAGYRCGGGLLNPHKLVRRLAQAVRAQGVLIYESTRALDVEDGLGGVIVRTSAATVAAASVVLATDAYQYWHPAFSGELRHKRRYALVTEPLTERQLETADWATRDGFVSPGANSIFGRLTWDSRIMISGGFSLRCRGADPAEGQSDAARVENRMISIFRRYFPTLDDVAFEYCYGGTIGITQDTLPKIGFLSPRIGYAYGYSGNGIVSCHTAARALSGLMLGQPGGGPDGDVLFLRGREPVYDSLPPPEPRAAAARGMRWTSG
jgi:glycine/D-amino acid oxidase-like deaminating enzyme